MDKVKKQHEKLTQIYVKKLILNYSYDLILKAHSNNERRFHVIHSIFT